MSTEKRRSVRRSAILETTLAYEKSGEMPRRERAVVLNLSESGAMLETKYRYPLRDLVRIEIKEAKLRGMATIRYCDPKGTHYQTGVEFTGGLLYRAPNE